MRKHVNLLTLVTILLTLQLGDFAAVSAIGDKRMTIEEWDKKENRRVSHIWMVSADGGPTTRLTNGDKGETSPQWSPDGSLVAFLADRDKGAQVWIIPFDGGEADKVTNE